MIEFFLFGIVLFLAALEDCESQLVDVRLNLVLLFITIFGLSSKTFSYNLTIVILGIALSLLYIFLMNRPGKMGLADFRFLIAFLVLAPELFFSFYILWSALISLYLVPIAAWNNDLKLLNSKVPAFVFFFLAYVLLLPKLVGLV